MFYCISVKQDKNTGCAHKSCKPVLMLFVLLSCSMVSFAESSDLPDSANKFQSFDNGQMRYSFPQWPLRKQVVREMIPPPPPGPYMSTALNDFSVKGFSFRRDFDRYKSSDELRAGNAEFKSNATEKSMDVFSPDRPWPEFSSSTHSRRDVRPRRWQPEIESSRTQNFSPNVPNAHNQLNKPGMYSGSAVNRESQLPSESR